MIRRAPSVFARSMAKGTFGNSGCGCGIACTTTIRLPASNARVDVTLRDSQELQTPAISPPSTANCISGAPLYPEMSCVGRLRADFKTRATSWVVAPGPVAPNLTGVVELIHLSMLVIPLALENAQT